MARTILVTVTEADVLRARELEELEPGYRPYSCPNALAIRRALGWPDPTRDTKFRRLGVGVGIVRSAEWGRDIDLPDLAEAVVAWFDNQGLVPGASFPYFIPATYALEVPE